MNSHTDRQISALSAEVEHLSRQLQAARRIALGLSAITRFEQLVQEALDISLEVIGAGAGSIILHDPKKDRLVFRYVVGEKAAELVGLELAPDQGIAGRVFSTGESDISEDVTQRKEHLREVGQRVGYVTQNMVTVALLGVEGKPIGVMQVLNKAQGRFDDSDVSLLEIMAAQIAAALETARLHDEARLAMVVRFIGNISHDVKNLMTPILTAAETLRLVAEDALNAFDSAVETLSCEQDRRLLQQPLLDLRAIYPEMLAMIGEGCDAVQQRMAEISAAVKGIVAKPFFQLTDVVALAHRVASLLAPQGRKQGIEVVVEIHEDVPQLVCDRKQIYNLIYNLIFNAMDDGVGASRISFRVRVGPRNLAFPEGSFFALECEDNGGGMPPEIKARLFTDEAVSTKAMGTGLGTRIIKNVVDAHQGRIELWSELGQGTRITCLIPTSLEPSAEGAEGRG